eukprot:1120704-Prymnesium_polylepis.1
MALSLAGNGVPLNDWPILERPGQVEQHAAAAARFAIRDRVRWALARGGWGVGCVLPPLKIV